MRKRTYRAVAVKQVDVEQLVAGGGERVVLGCDAAKDTWYGAWMTAAGEVLRIIRWDVVEDMAALLSGVRIAIDDFGTGYSTLSTLKDLPVHSLKIDQAFIKDLAESTKDLSIARAIITMAHGLGLTVVAEGVESEEQLELLREEGCDEVQGFLISKPVSSEQFEALLRDRGGPATAPVIVNSHASETAQGVHP